MKSTETEAIELLSALGGLTGNNGIVWELMNPEGSLSVYTNDFIVAF